LKKEIQIIIIGGTGFIGYHLAKTCVKKKWKVYSLSKKNPKKKRYIKGVHYIKCDITKKNKLKKIFEKDYDFVINLGGNVDHSNSKETYKSHYEGLKNLVEIVSSKSIKKFVQIGSGGEYGNAKIPHIESSTCRPKSIYYKSKYLATKYLLHKFKEKKFPFVIFRLYQAFGPHQDVNRLIPLIIMSCLKNKKFKCTEGKQYRDFIFIDDVVRAIIRSLSNKKSDGQIFNLGSGKPIKVKNLIEFIRSKIKKGKPLFGAINLRKDELLKVYPSIDKIKKRLNWRPNKNFFKNLENTINHYRHEI
jgi:nucleoside-diphosphate-sugar epimerase